MALNYTVSYKKNATSRLFPALAIENPQLYGDTPLRLTINMRGIDGRFVYEPRYGATIQIVDGMFEIDGTSISINNVLSTFFYQPAPEGGVDPVAVECSLNRHVGVDSVLERVDSGVINFVSRGFAAGEFPPEQPFSPVWITQTGTILDVTEGQTVSSTVSGVMSTRLVGIDVPYLGALRVISVPTEYSVQTVLVNGSVAEFDHDIDVLVITTPIKDIDIVEVRLNTPLIYSINYGSFPPGLGMDDAGMISGTVGVLPNAKIGVAQTFAFGLRVATIDGVYRDRRFVIKATPTTESIENPEWVDPEPPTGIQHIGTYTRGAPISYVIQTTAPNGVRGILTETVSNEASDENFSGLPNGVVLEPSGVVTGVIAPTTKTGTHYFTALLSNSRGEPVDTRNFSLSVTSPSGPLEPLRFVRWRTPAGSIGTFYEGEVCPVGIRAYSTTGEEVSYSILSNTPLPDGLNLDETTGDLRGVFAHVGATATITFTARATVGATFVDRDFILTVNPRYKSSGAVNVSFRLRRNEAAPMIADYSPLIPREDFFRVNDPNFGQLKEPMIYVIGGLRRSDQAPVDTAPCAPESLGATNGDPVEQVSDSIRHSKFGGPVKLRLGAHKVATVRIGSEIVYEVLYREVVDPLYRAGGFKLNNQGVPERDCIVHPQKKTYLYPESIKNLRYDFTLQVGFDAFDATQNGKLGIGGPENLPQWMTSPQSGTRQSSIIGFVPAMVVAYLKPGAGQRVLDRLAVRVLDTPYPVDEANPLANNHEVSFDQYYLSYDSISEQTTFDGGATTFDGDATRFDEYAYQKGKYQRMNPKGGN